jgi:hypothetical protein
MLGNCHKELPMSDLTKELYTQHRTLQDQQTYFLLAAAGAAIAFSVQKTLDAKFAWSLIPLAAAVVSWGLSFFFGCRNVNATQQTMLVNVQLLQLQQGIHTRQPSDPREVAGAIEVTREELNKSASTAGFFNRWQFRCLVLGGVLFIGWHVYEMYLRTVSTAPVTL